MRNGNHKLSRSVCILLVLVMCLTAVMEVALAEPAVTIDCQLPLPDGTYYVTVLSRYSGGKVHESYLTQYTLHGSSSDQPFCIMDIAATEGTPIYACADGTVKERNTYDKSGNIVVLEHADGSYSYYGHMRDPGLVSARQSVSRGQVIGYVGSTGQADGPHLHFEWTKHDPYCEFLDMGYDLKIKPKSGADVYPHVHPDNQAPEASSTAYITDVSERGFDISLFGKDDRSIRKAWCEVWTCGQTRNDAKTIALASTAAAQMKLRVKGLVIDWDTYRFQFHIDVADFDNFVGDYYVVCCMEDAVGNHTEVRLKDQKVCLYAVKSAGYLCQVTNKDGAGVHDAPYDKINGVSTTVGHLDCGEMVTVVGKYINSVDHDWYLLSDGNWVWGDRIKRTLDARMVEILVPPPPQ